MNTTQHEKELLTLAFLNKCLGNPAPGPSIYSQTLELMKKTRYLESIDTKILEGLPLNNLHTRLGQEVHSTNYSAAWRIVSPIPQMISNSELCMIFNKIVDLSGEIKATVGGFLAYNFSRNAFITYEDGVFQPTTAEAQNIPIWRRSEDGQISIANTHSSLGLIIGFYHKLQPDELIHLASAIKEAATGYPIVDPTTHEKIYLFFQDIAGVMTGLPYSCLSGLSGRIEQRAITWHESKQAMTPARVGFKDYQTTIYSYTTDSEGNITPTMYELFLRYAQFYLSTKNFEIEATERPITINEFKHLYHTVEDKHLVLVDKQMLSEFNFSRPDILDELPTSLSSIAKLHMLYAKIHKCITKPITTERVLPSAVHTLLENLERNGYGNVIRDPRLFMLDTSAKVDSLSAEQMQAVVTPADLENLLSNVCRLGIENALWNFLQTSSTEIYSNLRTQTILIPCPVLKKFKDDITPLYIRALAGEISSDKMTNLDASLLPEYILSHTSTYEGRQTLLKCKDNAKDLILSKLFAHYDGSEFSKIYASFYLLRKGHHTNKLFTTYGYDLLEKHFYTELTVPEMNVCEKILRILIAGKEPRSKFREEDHTAAVLCVRYCSLNTREIDTCPRFKEELSDFTSRKGLPAAFFAKNIEALPRELIETLKSRLTPKALYRIVRNEPWHKMECNFMLLILNNIKSVVTPDGFWKLFTEKVVINKNTAIAPIACALTVKGRQNLLDELLSFFNVNILINTVVSNELTLLDKLCDLRSLTRGSSCLLAVISRISDPLSIWEHTDAGLTIRNHRLRECMPCMAEYKRGALFHTYRYVNQLKDKIELQEQAVGLKALLGNTCGLPASKRPKM